MRDIRLVLGVDPGATGALVVLDGGQVATVLDMPDTIHNLVHELAKLLPLDLAVIEQVAPWKGTTTTANFKLGRNLGALEAAVAALQVPMMFAGIRAWKATFGLSAVKTQSRKRAQEYWPAAADYFRRAKDDGRAEAAFIALWGYQRANGFPLGPIISAPGLNEDVVEIAGDRL